MLIYYTYLTKNWDNNTGNYMIVKKNYLHSKINFILYY
jgi:hypothetical protein